MKITDYRCIHQILRQITLEKLVLQIQNHNKVANNIPIHILPIFAKHKTPHQSKINHTQLTTE